MNHLKMQSRYLIFYKYTLAGNFLLTKNKNPQWSLLYYNKSLTRNSMSTYAVFYTSIEQLSWTNQFLGPLLLQFNVLSCILIVEFKLGRYLERTFKLLFKTIKVNGFKVKFERRAARNQSASLILTVLNILLPFIPFSHWFQALTLTSKRRNFLSAWLLKT